MSITKYKNVFEINYKFYNSIYVSTFFFIL